jgi:Gpi18-like mannosyltransferase
MGIARDGYDKQQFEAGQQHNWAFFPFYPLIVRMAARLTGEFSMTGAMLSNIFFFAALIIVYKTALLFGADPATADLSVFYLAAFPTSYFFSLPVPESLFLLLSVSAFYFAKREQWWLAGGFGALASTTRLAGVFLWIPLALLYWQCYRKRVRLDVFCFCLLPAGLIAYMLYLRSITGNAFAFLEIHSAWGRHPTFFLQPLWSFVKNPWLLGAPWNFRVVNFASVVLAFACSAVLIKRRQFSMGLYALTSVIVPLSAGSELQSLTRFMGVVFPIFFVLGETGRSRRLGQIISAVFILMLGLLTAMFALRITMAMA